MNIQDCLKNAAVTAALLMNACSHSPPANGHRSASSARSEFVLTKGGTTVYCREVPRRRHAAHLFYEVTFCDSRGRITSRMVRRPLRPGREVPYQGTSMTMEIPRDPRLNAEQIIAAVPADQTLQNAESASNRNAEPWNILPAVILTSPLTAAAAPLDAARELLREKDPIGSMLKRGVRPGISKTDALRILKRKATVFDNGVRIGPGHVLADQSVWLEFRENRLTGLYTGDFYPMGK